jgi:hypothetical protein
MLPASKSLRPTPYKQQVHLYLIITKQLILIWLTIICVVEKACHCETAAYALGKCAIMIIPSATAEY